MKRKTRTFRVRASLDVRLIDAALDNGRSVSEEIEYRIERSFDGNTSGVEIVDLIGCLTE